MLEILGGQLLRGNANGETVAHREVLTVIIPPNFFANFRHCPNTNYAFDC